MQAFILTLHVIGCVALVLLVLLQSGKEGMGVIFGGGSGSVFGSSGAGGLLVKLTAAVFTLFLVTSLTYNFMTTASHSGDSTIAEIEFEEPAQEQAPANEINIEDAAPAADTQQENTAQ